MTILDISNNKALYLYRIDSMKISYQELPKNWTPNPNDYEFLYSSNNLFIFSYNGNFSPVVVEFKLKPEVKFKIKMENL